jgi:hypothetical protein
VVTGNGDFDADNHDYGDTLLKLALADDNLVVRDYFTPHDQQMLSEKDQDLGGGGVVLLPDQNGAHPHLVMAGGTNRSSTWSIAIAWANPPTWIPRLADIKPEPMM